MLEKRIATNGHIYAKLSSLSQWDKNPRDIYEGKFENLKILIASLGLFKPLFVTAEGIMVGGNMRLPAIQWLNENILEWVDNKGNSHTIDKRGKFDEVHIVELDFADTGDGKIKAMLDGEVQEKVFENVEQAMIEYAVADNLAAGFYDQQKAAELFLPHQEAIDMKILDLQLAPPVTMETFVNEYQPPENNTNPGVEDEPPSLAPEGEEPISQRGEVYQLGAHRIMCGDSTSFEDMQKLMGEQVADMVFTDPPYNVDYGAKNEALNETDRGNRMDADIKNDKFDTSEAFYNFLKDAFTNMFAVLKAGAAVYVCHADSERVNFTKAFVDSGFKLAQVLIWSKQHFVLGRQDYQWQHEPMLYGWKEGEGHYFNGGHGQTTIWHVDKPASSKEHPTMKPVTLVARALNNSCPPDGLVLDPFSGSGTTLIACEQLGRTCYAMELDPKYVDVIRKRYARYLGKSENWEELTPAITENEDSDAHNEEVAQ